MQVLSTLIISSLILGSTVAASSGKDKRGSPLLGSNVNTLLVETKLSGAITKRQLSALVNGVETDLAGGFETRDTTGTVDLGPVFGTDTGAPVATGSVQKRDPYFPVSLGQREASYSSTSSYSGNPVSSLSSVIVSLEVGLPSLSIGISKDCASGKTSAFSSSASLRAGLTSSLGSGLSSISSLLSGACLSLTSGTSGITSGLGSITTVTTAHVEETIDNVQSLTCLLASIKANLNSINGLLPSTVAALQVKISTIEASIPILVSPLVILATSLETSTIDTTGLSCAIAGLQGIASSFQSSFCF